MTTASRADKATADASARSTANIDADRDTAVLTARGVAKAYTTGIWPRRRRVQVLTGADVDLRPGEIVGLVGENGSGKSTLMKILVGSLARDAGTLHRNGTLGYCPQEPILYERLTCDEHFELYGEAYRLNPLEIDRSRDEVYDVLGFGRWAGARVEELSGGTRAKLNLGLALLSDPQVLLLDEPYAGFDWDTYLRFWEITATRRDEGRSLLIISHFITDEDRFDRIYDLRDGQTVPR
ncbi:MAG: ATP-binding cassette domain-containing protein [Acidimicrobiales bacterium]